MVAQHTQSGQAEECTVSKMSAKQEQANQALWRATHIIATIGCDTMQDLHEAQSILSELDKLRKRIGKLSRTELQVMEVVN